MKYQTEMSRGHLPEDEHSRKEIRWLASPAFGRRANQRSFSAMIILCLSPLAFLYAFTHGRSLQSFRNYFTVFAGILNPLVLLGGNIDFSSRCYPLQIVIVSIRPFHGSKTILFINQLPKPIWADAALQDLDSDKLSAFRSKLKPPKCPTYCLKIRRHQSTSHNTFIHHSKLRMLVAAS